MNPTLHSYSISNNRCTKEPDFGFDDIQKGDTVKITKTHKDGTVVDVTGVADNKISTGLRMAVWKSASGNTLAANMELAGWKNSYELVSRPEPKDHVVVCYTDGEIGTVQTAPRTKQASLEIRDRWNGEAERARGNEYRVMKLVEADA